MTGGVGGVASQVATEAGISYSSKNKGKNNTTKDPGLGNQFKNKIPEQVKKAMDKQVEKGKLEKKYTDPVSGSTSYKNKNTGYSYNVDIGKSGKTGKK